MILTPTFADVRRAVRNILDAHRPEIEGRLQLVVPDLKMGMILEYYTGNVDAGMYPLIMLEQTRESTEWVAMPVVANHHFELDIWGLVHYDRPELMDDLVAELAGAVRDVLNQRHEPIQVGPFEIYFNEQTPVTSVEYGAQQFGSAIVRGFNASWGSDVCFTNRDERRTA